MKTILITGATSGFGQAAARLFAKQGWQVVITGRRTQRLDALKTELEKQQVPVHSITLDVRDSTAVAHAVESLPSEFSKIDVLVNNAGLALGLEPAYETKLSDWDQMVDTNVKGLMYCTRAILPKMVARNVGHIINIGSMAGRYPYPGGNVYGSTKAFVYQFSRNLRSDLIGTAIRVTNLEPGLCGESEYSQVRFGGDKAKAAKVYEGTESLTNADIANTIYWVATLPRHVNVNSMEIMPVCQTYGALPIERNLDFTEK